MITKERERERGVGKGEEMIWVLLFGLAIRRIGKVWEDSDYFEEKRQRRIERKREGRLHLEYNVSFTRNITG